MSITRTSHPHCSATTTALLLVRLEVPKQGMVTAITFSPGRPIRLTARALIITARVESTPPEMPTTQWSREAYSIRFTRPDTCMSICRSQ